MNKLLNKLQNIISKYPNLCFKFDVRIMPVNYQISLYPRKNVLPSELNFNEVNYFHIDKYRIS